MSQAIWKPWYTETTRSIWTWGGQVKFKYLSNLVIAKLYFSSSSGSLETPIFFLFRHSGSLFQVTPPCPAFPVTPPFFYSGVNLHPPPPWRLLFLPMGMLLILFLDKRKPDAFHQDPMILGSKYFGPWDQILCRQTVDCSSVRGERIWFLQANIFESRAISGMAVTKDRRKQSMVG